MNISLQSIFLRNLRLSGRFRESFLLLTSDKYPGYQTFSEYCHSQSVKRYFEVSYRICKVHLLQKCPPNPLVKDPLRISFGDTLKGRSVLVLERGYSNLLATLSFSGFSREAWQLPTGIQTWIIYSSSEGSWKRGLHLFDGLITRVKGVHILLKALLNTSMQVPYLEYVGQVGCIRHQRVCYPQLRGAVAKNKIKKYLQIICW